MKNDLDHVLVLFAEIFLCHPFCLVAGNPHWGLFVFISNMIILIVLVNIDCFCWSSEFDPPFLPLVEEVFVAVWLKKLYFSSFRNAESKKMLQVREAREGSPGPTWI